LLGFWVGVALVAAVAVPAYLVLHSSPAKVDENAAVAPSKPVVLSGPAFTAKTGVEVAQVAVTGGGGLVDLRYRVVDPDKANAVHERQNPPGLVDEATGAPVWQLVMGHAHKGQLKAGVTYYLVFYNPDDVVKRGNLVTVQLGGARLQHVHVR
jgi:hypothetical protein